MRSFPHPKDSTGLLYRIAAYMAAITLVVAAGMAGLVHLAGPSEKIESGPRLRMSPTLGIAAKAEDHEISAARARNPVWIAPTTKYAYAAPPPRAAAKVVVKTVVKPKPKAKPRAQPDADQGALAYGYAAQPRRSLSFQSPFFFRDSVQ